MKKHDMRETGKCGIVVKQRARHGIICYTAFIPINPRTPAQVRVRGNWRAANARWPKLREEWRRSWCEVAETINSKPRGGQQGKLTGYLLFMKISAARENWDLPPVDLPPARPRFPKLAVARLLVTNVGNAIKISLSCPHDPGVHTLLRASAPLSAGRNTCTQFRVIGKCPTPKQGCADITDLYIARFGVPRVGSKIFVQVNQMIDGWEDEPVEFTFVVPVPQAERGWGKGRRQKAECRIAGRGKEGDGGCWGSDWSGRRVEANAPYPARWGLLCLKTGQREGPPPFDTGVVRSRRAAAPHVPRLGQA